MSGVSPAYSLLAWVLVLPAALWASWALGERRELRLLVQGGDLLLVSLSAGLARPSSESLFLIVVLLETVKRG